MLKIMLASTKGGIVESCDRHLFFPFFLPTDDCTTRMWGGDVYKQYQCHAREYMLVNMLAPVDLFLFCFSMSGG